MGQRLSVGPVWEVTGPENRGLRLDVSGAVWTPECSDRGLVPSDRLTGGEHGGGQARAELQQAEDASDRRFGLLPTALGALP